MANFDANFNITALDGKARAGTLSLRRGIVPTPMFMPVGTYSMVKGLVASDLAALGAPIMLSNTFHLYLRPGLEVMRTVGGLNAFNNWSAPILTDSGGYQVFSLNAKITEEGAVFRSPIDGRKIHLTPEHAIAIQHTLDVDIMMVLDECTAYPASKDVAAASMQRSMRWAARCLAVHHKDSDGAKAPHPSALFGIAQGGMHADLRRESIDILKTLNLPGYALGGFSVGEPMETMYALLDAVADDLPADKPRYLMGVGKPLDLLHAIGTGLDMFDCVLPSRNARNGHLYTNHGVIRIKNQKYRHDTRPVEAGCACPCCQTISRAYLHYLFKINDMGAARFATLHNLHFYLELMREARRAIEAGTFAAFCHARCHLHAPCDD